MCPKQRFYLSIHFNSSLGNLVLPSKENPDDPTDAFDTVVDQLPNVLRLRPMSRPTTGSYPEYMYMIIFQ